MSQTRSAQVQITNLAAPRHSRNPAGRRFRRAPNRNAASQIRVGLDHRVGLTPNAGTIAGLPAGVPSAS